MKKIILIAAAALMISSPVNAKTTVNDLISYCGNQNPFDDRASWCAGYITGTVDFTLRMWRLTGNQGKGRSHCIPSSVTNGQLYAIAKKYIEQRPEKYHLSAGTLVTFALHEAFKC